MIRKLTVLASLVIAVGLLSPVSVAQDEIYDFDGVADVDPQPADPTDWMTSENWGESGFDPDGAFGPLLPDFGTRVEIEESDYGVNAPVIGPGDTAEAFGVRIGRGNGAGLLTMTGGTLDIDENNCPLDCSRRIRVGAAQVLDPINRHPGTFNLSGGTVTTDTLWIGSGSHGEMNMSGGVVNTRALFYFDWTYDSSSVLNMTAGSINVGSQLLMHRTSVLNLAGGEILLDGAARLGTELDNPAAQGGQQTPNVTVSITGGLLESGDFLQIGGSAVLDGGILRANSFNEAVSTGTVEINGSGLLQFNNAFESVAAVEGLITSGVITTSEALPLTVTIVDVGGTNFTTVAVVPEPSSVVLVLLASITMFYRYRSL